MASMYPPPRRRPLRRRPIRHGLTLGLVMVAAEAFGAYAPAELGRTVANGVVLPVLASAWVLALFAGWLGRGARSGWSAVGMGAVGLLSVSVVRLAGDFGLAVMRGSSVPDTVERLIPNATAWLAGPVSVGVIAGFLGWLTTLVPGWLDELRRANGPSARDGAPETPIRHYSDPRAAVAPTRPMPTAPGPTAGWPRADDAPTQEIPAYGWPASGRTPVEVDHDPTRPNSTRWGR